MGRIRDNGVNAIPELPKALVKGSLDNDALQATADKLDEAAGKAWNETDRQAIYALSSAVRGIQQLDRAVETGQIIAPSGGTGRDGVEYSKFTISSDSKQAEKLAPKD
jgi:hypothetical protein